SMRAPSSPSLSPCPRWSNASAANPLLVAARAKSAWFSLRDPDPWRITTAGTGPSPNGSQRSYARPSTRPDSSGVSSDGIMSSIMAATALSHSYPLGTRVNDRGHLEVGGCDVVELADRFGTP